jgi:small subunit ribosomal protein S16
MLKIRLRRIGAIRQPHYRIVVADARSPRDGRFLEILGHYNPRTEPATIQVDVAKYNEWKRKGAQPTDAVASLVKQFNRRAAAAAETPAALDRRTRTASGKRVSGPGQPVAAEATEETEEATEAVEAVEAVEVEEAPVAEAAAEAAPEEVEAPETAETAEVPATAEADTDTAS